MACMKIILKRLGGNSDEIYCEMASDFGPMGVRVNAIAPGEIKTDMISPKTEEKLAPTIPLCRLGTKEEVADIIFFYALIKRCMLMGLKYISMVDNTSSVAPP